MRRGKRKKKLLAATGLFAAASAEAEAAEDALQQQQQQLKQQMDKRLQQQPQLVADPSAIRANRIVRRGGPPIVRKSAQLVPILRTGVAPGNFKHISDNINDKAKVDASPGLLKAQHGPETQAHDSADLPSKTPKRRKMDDMLDEMKVRQSMTKASKPVTKSSSNYVSSTNLAVKNLSPSVTEEVLLREFGKFGPLVSIQILWPDDSRRRQPNSGFVSFQRREDAEKAFEGLSKLSLYDFELILDWAEPLLNPESLAPLNKEEGSDDLVIKSDDRPHFQDAPIPPHFAKIIIQRPSDLMLRQRIERTAQFVATDGNSFEALLKKREQDNNDFFWLFDTECKEHQYYRWRVVANVMGEKKLQWRTEPFRYFSFDEHVCYPPEYPSEEEKLVLEKLQKSQLNRHERNVKLSKDRYMTGAARERKKNSLHLEDPAHDRLVELMENVTLERDSILGVMGFCLDYSEFASDCSRLLVDSLVNAKPDQRSPPKLIARLYVLSDVLHNSNAAVKNASAYRNELQPRLPSVFRVLNSVYRAAGGRMTANNIKVRVCKVLSAWHSWMLLSPTFVLGLETTFLHLGKIDTVVTEMPPDKKQAFDEAIEKYKALTEDEVHAKCKQIGIPHEDRTLEELVTTVAVVEVEIASQKVAVPDEDVEPEEKTDNLVELIPTTSHRTEQPDEAESDIDGESLDDSDIDGEPLSDDD